MKIKYPPIRQLLSFLLLLQVFISCGGGGGGSETKQSIEEKYINLKFVAIERPLESESDLILGLGVSPNAKPPIVEETTPDGKVHTLDFLPSDLEGAYNYKPTSGSLVNLKIRPEQLIQFTASGSAVDLNQLSECINLVQFHFLSGKNVDPQEKSSAFSWDTFKNLKKLKTLNLEMGSQKIEILEQGLTKLQDLEVLKFENGEVLISDDAGFMQLEKLWVLAIRSAKLAHLPTLSGNLLSIDLYNNNLSVSEIQNILNQLAAMGRTNGLLLAFFQTPKAAISPSYDALTTLKQRGWQIFTD